MSPDSRTLIAAMAWAATHNSRCAWIYDYDLKVHREVSASATGESVGAYDHARRCVLQGVLGQAAIDHAYGGYITLERTPNGLKGYDHVSKAFYDAVVLADTVSVYDYGDERHHAYFIGAT